jgi:L-fuconolactonase
VIDTHIHLASDNLEHYPLAEHPPFHTESYVYTEDDFLSDMNEAGVRQATIVQPFGLYGFDSSYHADAAQRHADRFVSICGVATDREGADALRYWVQERGVSGVRIMTLGQGVNLHDDGFGLIFATAAQLDVPVCLLTSTKHLVDLPAIAGEFSNTRIVLDHLGWAGPVKNPHAITESLAPLIPTENVFLKLSTPLLSSGNDGRRVVEFVLERFGPSRVVWGSNFPVTDMGGYATTVKVTKAALSFLSDDDRDWVLDRTALALWPRLAPAVPS